MSRMDTAVQPAFTGPPHPQAIVDWINAKWCVTVTHMSAVEQFWVDAPTEDEAALLGLDMYDAAHSLPGMGI